MLIPPTLISFFLLFSATASSSPPTTKIMSTDKGGAINEKIRSSTTKSTPTTSDKCFSSGTRSHLLYALEGMDRYPNYLSRWNERDMDELELALQQQLQKVQQQRETIRSRRNSIAKIRTEAPLPPSLTRPQTWDQVKELLDPALSKSIFRSRQFRKQPPPLDKVLSGEITVELEAHVLEDLMDQEVYDVYSLPLFRSSFCDELRGYIRKLKTLGDASLRMATRAADLDHVDLEWINDLLLHLVVRPISRHLYKDTECGGGDLDWRQGYVAAYSADTSGQQNRLVAHTDDSEITLNVGLGESFEGGLLQFWGLRGESQEHLGDYEPAKGRAVLHAGRHFHQVTQVTNGDRYALILWSRSWNGVRTQTCPCCWMNRREDNNCVCGPRWN